MPLVLPFNAIVPTCPALPVWTIFDEHIWLKQMAALQGRIMSANCRSILRLQKPRQRGASAEVLPIRPGLKVINVRQAQQLPPEQEVDSSNFSYTDSDFSDSKAERAPADQPKKRKKRRTKYGFR